ncbi:hypothetical protein BH09SUM1_BH09SUM1_21250 [soil metagenome]
MKNMRVKRSVTKQQIGRFFPYDPGPLLLFSACLYSFFFFRSQFPLIAYDPSHRYQTFFTYHYQSLLLLAMFFFPISIAARGRIPQRVAYFFAYVFCLATLGYLSVIVSSRPELIQANDRAEAITIILDSIRKFQYPYLIRTHLGGYLTPLTGTAIVGLPGYLAAHRPELMTPVIIILFCTIACWRDARSRLAIHPLPLLALLTIGPAVVPELAYGSDLIWGPLLLGASLLFVRMGNMWAFVALVALGSYTRSEFLPLGAVCVACAWRQGFIRPRHALAVSILIALQALPFLLWDWRSYLYIAPFGVASKKLDLGFPPDESLLTNIFNTAFHEGAQRTVGCFALLLLLCAIFVFKSRTLFDTALSLVAITCMMDFLMGPYFLLDYMVWPYAFFVLALVLRERGDGKLFGRVIIDVPPSPG